MTDVKRTPGPWFSEPSYGIGPFISNKDGTIAKIVFHGGDEHVVADNAEFIVTACNAHDDLVVALERVMPLLEVDGLCLDCEDYIGSRDAIQHTPGCAVLQAREALRLARGE